MEYNFKFSLTEDEYADYNAYAVWSAPWHQKKRLNFVIKQLIYLTIVVIGTMFFLSKTRPQKKGNGAYNIIAGASIVLIITSISYYQVPFRIKNKAKKLVNKEENNLILTEQELEINNNGITTKDKMSSTNQSWNSIVKYAATKDYFFLFINSIQALIIPKRLFNSQKEINEFDKFITEKTPLSSSFRSIGI